MSKSTGKRHDKTILWGGPGSAYSARIYSYLVKKGIPFQRIFPGNSRFHEEIVPIVGYFVMPVMELTDGTLIQDSTDAMLYWETQVADNPLIPSSPQQRAVSWLLAFFGAEMMLRIGMHYRWTYLDADRPFAEAMFANFFSNARDPDAKRKDTAPIMDYFGSFLPDLAITDETIPAIEAAYIDLLEILNTHFLKWPYLLGGRPGPADFGLITLMYAHLSRDPHASHLMKMHGPQVFRWTERMNEPGIVDGEFSEIPPAYPADDTLPETLLPVLRYLCAENKAEILAMVASFNAWCAARPDLQSGAPLRTDPDTLSAHPKLGEFTFHNRGVTFRMQTLASVLFTFQRALDEIDKLDGPGRQRFEQTMSAAGGNDVLGARLNRRIRLAVNEYTIV